MHQTINIQCSRSFGVSRGVGKTTIAAALVQEQEILSSFEKIVWVSVGQDPDIRELQDSIHHQLTKKHFPDSVSSDADAVTAIRDAAKNTNVLLVLDDVWDPQHEKSLNVIDNHNASRMLITTRIRGLVARSAEVELGVLPQEEAFKLLLSSAEVEEEDVPEGSDEHRIAVEMCELCGRLPLTISISGGMVSEYGQGFTEDIIDVMKEGDALEDEEGLTLEERVISSSVKMLIKGAKNKVLVEKVFKFFAVFPEDVPVPAAFLNKMSPLLTDDKSEKKARLAVGSSLSTLLKYNLIKGSLSIGKAQGQGVFMHDIVRDYVINQHSEDERRALQKSVVATILAARPESGGGFPTADMAGMETFGGYCARQLYFHFRGALEEGENPPDSWLMHPDIAIKTGVALAIGLEAISALSDEQEAASELVRAAHTAHVASLHKKCTSGQTTDFLYRAAGLLERADDKEVSAFEITILRYCFVM